MERKHNVLRTIGVAAVPVVFGSLGCGWMGMLVGAVLSDGSQINAEGTDMYQYAMGITFAVAGAGLGIVTDIAAGIVISHNRRNKR